jgi:hypothetical protein
MFNWFSVKAIVKDHIRDYRVFCERNVKQGSIYLEFTLRRAIEVCLADYQRTAVALNG